MKRRLQTGLICATAVVDVTPPAGLPMGGYIARGGAVATGTLDPLTASIVRLRPDDGAHGGDGVTWIALDALAVDHDLASSIAVAVAAATGVTPGSVIVGASHTHSGPSGWIAGLPFVAPEPGDPAMRSELVGRIAHAARALSATEVRVRADLSVFDVDGVGTNRHDPTLPIDRSAGVLRLLDGNGAVYAIVVDHGSHPTVLGHDNLGWSADWPGAARLAMTAAFSGGASAAPVVSFLQGAAGEVSPRFVRHGQTPDETSRIGRRFAEQALARVAMDASAAAAPPILGLRRTVVTVSTRRYSTTDLLDRRVAETERAWHATRVAPGDGTPDERIARTAHEGAMTARAMATAGLPSAVDVPISVVVIGRDAWLHLPVELFSSLALEIRAASPFRQTRVVGYADGYLGYMVDERADRIGGYEAASSLFDQPGTRAFVDAALAMLRQTHDELS